MRALLEQALNALNSTNLDLHADAVEAIRAHLAQPQGEPVAAAGEDLAIYQSIADNYFKSIHPAHTESDIDAARDCCV